MKKKIFAFLALAFMTASCTQDQVENNEQIVTNGNWKVSLFIDSGNDETSDFTGYSFSFSNGTVMAVKNNFSISGLWSFNSSRTKFNIDLGPKTDTNKPLGELTDDWKIISINDTEIRLVDDSSPDEQLTFTRL